MKLLIVLSVIASSYAAKLDRTYLPPASAATAGGSPGALKAPSGADGFGPARGSGASGFQPSGSAGPSTFGQPSGPSNFGQPSGFGAPAPATKGFGQAGPQAAPGNYGQAPAAFGQQSTGFDQGGAFDQGAQGPAVFSGAGQASQQPERAQAAADRNAEILRYENQNDGETFSYAFETSNGISAEESGVATNGVQAQGAFAYTGDDGQNYRVTYTADENGYQPQGDHLPTPPPIPEEILRAIEKNAAAAAAGIQEGAYNPDEDNSDSPQQYTADGGYSSGPASFNQPQARPGQQAPTGQQGGAYNQQPGAFNQGGAPNQQAGSYNQGSNAGFPGSGPAQPQKPGQFNLGASGAPGNRGSQAQGDNGYEYNRPQSKAQFGSGAQGSPGQFNRPASQGAAFSRPSSPSDIGPSSFGPQPAPQGPSTSYSRPSGPAASGKGSFGSQAYNQPAARPQSPGSSRPSGSSSPSLGFRPQYNQPAQNGPQKPSGSFPRPSGPQSFRQAGSTQGGAEGYQYNRPGQSGSQGGQPGSFGSQPGAFPRPSGPSQGFQGSAQPSFGAQGPQRQGAQGFKAPQGPQPGRGQTFEGPQQPPSFSEQEGYKY